MPDVQIRYPLGICLGVEQKREFMGLVRSIVAQELDCKKFDGTPLRLNTATGQRTIDVHLIRYDEDDVLFDSPRVLIQIQGYPYPERMENIDIRLAYIKDAIAEILPWHARAGVNDVFVTFIRVEDGCYA